VYHRVDSQFDGLIYVGVVDLGVTSSWERGTQSGAPAKLDLGKLSAGQGYRKPHVETEDKEREVHTGYWGVISPGSSFDSVLFLLHREGDKQGVQREGW